MIRVLLLTYVSMAAYGAFTGLYGAAMLAALSAAVMHYAEHKFRQQDAQWDNSLMNPRTPPSVMDTLSDCECMACTSKQIINRE